MNQYDTDKEALGLLDEYNLLFAEIKNNPIKYLEVGIHRGGSLMWAKDFFPLGKIYGIDNKILDLPFNFIVANINQNDSNGLRQFAEKNGLFNIIIDDGSHLAQETENTFNALWPYVKPGGAYIIEDWRVGLGAYGYQIGFLAMGQLILNLTETPDLAGANIRRLPRLGTYALYRKKL